MCPRCSTRVATHKYESGKRMDGKSLFIDVCENCHEDLKSNYAHKKLTGLKRVTGLHYPHLSNEYLKTAKETELRIAKKWQPSITKS